MSDKNYFSKSILPAIICHIVTFLFVMVMVPVFCRGWRDMIWFSLRIISAVLIAAIFTIKYHDMHPMVYFFLSVIQDLLGFVFRPQLSRIYGIPLTPLGEFEYIGQVFVWITGIVILQIIVIAVVRQWYMRKKGNR